MAFTVFFREANQVLIASDFISQQPISHRELLQTLADALAVNGVIVHPQVTKTSKGEWSVFLKDDNNDVYTYTLFTSRLEQVEVDRDRESKKVSSKRALVIIDPAGVRDSVGGYHPGYWSISHYASLLEEQQSVLFLKTIEQIEQNVLSDDYGLNKDGSVSIHINRAGGAYTISVVCRAEWRSFQN